MKCTHHACRCARAAELAAIADRTGDGRHLLEAVQLHAWDLEVECRLRAYPPCCPRCGGDALICRCAR